MRNDRVKMQFLTTVYGFLVLAITCVLAAPSIPTSDNSTLVCKQLRSALGNVTILPADGQYVSVSEENWCVTKEE